MMSIYSNVSEMQVIKVHSIQTKTDYCGQNQKTKAPTKTMIDTKKCNQVKYSKKERHKCQNCPKSQNWIYLY